MFGKSVLRCLTEDTSQIATWEHDTSINPQSVVQSHSLTPVPSLLLTLAPFSTRNFTVFTWPLSAAQCRGDICRGEEANITLPIIN